MKKIKKGDNVTRNSYNNDIIFKVDKIIKKSNNINIAILKGIDIRIEADAQIEDLKLVSKNEKQNLDIEFKKRIRNSTSKNNCDERLNGIIKTGKILHLDGDKKYAGKSEMYYKKMGLNAIVKNIPENKQSKMVKQLLMIYNPDILVITGHDAYYRKRGTENELASYKNSGYFVLSNIAFKSISFVVSERLILAAIIAGSNACIFILFGLEAKFAPAFINSS